jgi:hypothetical protein
MPTEGNAKSIQGADTGTQGLDAPRNSAGTTTSSDAVARHRLTPSCRLLASIRCSRHTRCTHPSQSLRKGVCVRGAQSTTSRVVARSPTPIATTSQTKSAWGTGAQTTSSAHVVSTTRMVPMARPPLHSVAKRSMHAQYTEMSVTHARNSSGHPWRARRGGRTATSTPHRVRSSISTAHHEAPTALACQTHSSHCPTTGI